ncbi:kelch-like protein [Paenibacillus macerans]|uniref:Kelch repeat-containing protein n=1 Tax=Paenibacillus macerans TaxID=44252 RepID=UPI00203A6BF2|nr:kelch-like protein [Paenibacillus macerans]MCM3701084.1 hypothetical protein [Paenibacillus macerans]
MKRKYVLTFAALLSLMLFLNVSLVSAAEDGQWIPRSDLPEPRTAHSSAVYKGEIYVFGGTKDSRIAFSGTKTNTTYKYDPLTDTWTKKANMPTTRAASTAAVVGDKIYVIGGYHNVNNKLVRTNVVEIYDPLTDTWTKGVNVPVANSWSTSVSIDNLIYVFGGTDDDSKYEKSVYVYNTINNTWSKKKETPFTFPASVDQINGKIYATGTTNGTDTFIYEYDPVNDSWNIVTQVSPRKGAALIAYNNKLYLLGGYLIDNDDSPVDLAEVYDLKTNQVSEFTKLTFPRWQHSSVIVDNNLFVIGGTTGDILGILKTVEMYSFGEHNIPDPQEPEQPTGKRAILVVTMDTGLEKEFDLSMEEVNAFITWYENKQAGTGTASYAVDKHDNNKGPFSVRKDYVIFDKILTFEVNEYNVTNE